MSQNAKETYSTQIAHATGWIKTVLEAEHSHNLIKN